MADPNDPIKRAGEAERLMRHPLVQEAREHMRADLTKAAWKRHEITELEQAKLDALMQHYDAFFAYFERVMADGRMAEAEIKERGRIRRTVDRVRKAI
jgi:hypothetical protein